jgi:DNA-binding response OmpR family regulator
MTHRVLVAEDDANTRAAIAEVLRGEGYDVLEAGDGVHAKSIFDRSPPDIACLDVMMPGLSGYDLCKHFRHESPTMPILFLTAKAEEVDKVIGLELGGDDYIVKPFGRKELVARIRAVARRCLTPVEHAADDDTTASMQFCEQPFMMNGLQVLPRELRARRDQEVIALTLRELRILQTLSATPGEVVTRAELFRRAWEEGPVPNSRTIDQTISQLRKRIEANPKQPQIIQTVYGVGYRFDPA